MSFYWASHLKIKTLLKALLNELSEHSSMILKSFTSQVRKLKADRLALKFICFNLRGTWATSQGSNKRSVHCVVLNYFEPIHLFQGLKNNNTACSLELENESICHQPIFPGVLLAPPKSCQGMSLGQGHADILHIPSHPYFFIHSCSPALYCKQLTKLV